MLYTYSLYITQNNEFSIFCCYFTCIWENNGAAPGKRIQKSLAAVNVLKMSAYYSLNKLLLKNDHKHNSST